MVKKLSLKNLGRPPKFLKGNLGQAFGDAPKKLGQLYPPIVAPAGRPTADIPLLPFATPLPAAGPAGYCALSNDQILEQNNIE